MHLLFYKFHFSPFFISAFTYSSSLSPFLSFTTSASSLLKFPPHPATLTLHLYVRTCLSFISSLISLLPLCFCCPRATFHIFLFFQLSLRFISLSPSHLNLSLIYYILFFLPYLSLSFISFILPILSHILSLYSSSPSYPLSHWYSILPFSSFIQPSLFPSYTPFSLIPLDMRSRHNPFRFLHIILPFSFSLLHSASLFLYLHVSLSIPL